MAQEHAHDHDQSIKMKNCKNTYPFFFNKYKAPNNRHVLY